MEPTRIYVKTMLAMRDTAKGFVHVTGGGFLENIPRILPPGHGARIDLGSWEIPPVFEFLRARGNLSDRDQYRTFNMGIGMIAILSAEAAENLPNATIIGEVTAGEPGVRLS